MQKIINFLRGSVRFTITGAFPERFLNLCAQNGVAFWDLAWLDEHTLRLRLTRRDRRRGADLAEKVQCEARAERPLGVPHFLAGFRRRYALLAGLALAVFTVAALSQFILTVDVSGNDRVTTAEILSQLGRCGLRLGKYGPAVNEREVSHEVLLSIPELSWMAVNLHGTRAEVIVREKVQKPEVPDRTKPSHVAAAATGVITHMEVLEGAPQRHEGDTVMTGDVLISGIMDLPEPKWSETDLGVRVVHAEGRVYARTWRTLTAQIPLTAQVKVYTGQEKTTAALTVLDKRVNIFGNAGIFVGKYDKITTTHCAALPGGREMPLALTVERRRAYETEAVPVDRAAAETLLKSGLEDRLKALVGDGEVQKMDFSADAQNGTLTVTLLAKCQEQIGRVREFEGEIGVNPPGIPGSVGTP